MGTPVSSTNETDRHDIAEILLKLSLNAITLSHSHSRDFNNEHNSCLKMSEVKDP